MLLISLLIAVLMIVYPDIMTYVPYLGIRKLPPARIRNLGIAWLVVTPPPVARGDALDVGNFSKN